jgi:hypothetical protein
MNARATFSSMELSTADDWKAIGAEFPATARTLPDRILGHLNAGFKLIVDACAEGGRGHGKRAG